MLQWEKKYTAVIVKRAAMMMNKRNVKIIEKIILPNFDCSSSEAMELETAKKTNGTTLTNNKLRKISPSGLRKSTAFGKKIPRKLPAVIPMIRSIIPE